MPNTSFSPPVPPAFYQITAGRIVRELWWTNQEFSSIDIIPLWFFMFIYHLGMNNRPVGGHRSVT
jgi:hypothetical protein